LERHKQRMLADIQKDIYKDAPLNQKADYWNLICELECVDIKLVESAAEAIERHQALPEIAHMMSKEPETEEYTPHVPFLYAKEDNKEEEEQEQEEAEQE
jgi:hypothetical protein